MPADETPARPPTLNQVAARAGVSLKTASRALNGEPYVSRATERRVRQAADELGYRLNGLARELRTGGTSALVGLISGDLANPFYSAVASGAERELRRHGLLLITVNNDEDGDLESSQVQALVERRVRALLVIPSGGGIDAHNVPLVFLDRPPPAGRAADSVLIDNDGGARTAAAHLLAGGHRRIALVADLARTASQQARITGFTAAMRAAGNVDWEPYVRTDVHDAATAGRVVTELLALPFPPTALFTTNNRVTIGALRALRDHPVRPALVGFDDFELADVVGVTVVAHDTVEMGRAAARLAYDRIGGYTGPPRTVIIPTRLIPRGSAERPAGRLLPGGPPS
ncbi:LacI family transcriptional regulator [Actinoplanes sp. SE50]|uniref:LacI family DNA-binding transcriptional regulator n=1 Tax=unclassified Actinoplanes TaxID=2626549 RepID=UPI00023EC5AA|nr:MULTISPECIES: LacI family DNA-binding transcriptional regulator [unclassified Actinoplanes]AEV83059.1 LacI family transcriptional regulator [Actinoplanes sp. SE50/110]ATO81455.1 LacI family transcriptional regulator [Actinoplanes sp. SE50]SLL98862.1 LacI family transcriptional regulator [Actinoplanes sp. SE50/110]